LVSGSWSALRAKERDPDLDVVLLEADVCGGDEIDPVPVGRLPGGAMEPAERLQDAGQPERVAVRVLGDPSGDATRGGRRSRGLA